MCVQCYLCISLGLPMLNVYLTWLDFTLTSITTDDSLVAANQRCRQSKKKNLVFLGLLDKCQPFSAYRYVIVISQNQAFSFESPAPKLTFLAQVSVLVTGCCWVLAEALNSKHNTRTAVAKNIHVLQECLEIVSFSASQPILHLVDKNEMKRKILESEKVVGVLWHFSRYMCERVGGLPSPNIRLDERGL